MNSGFRNPSIFKRKDYHLPFSSSKQGRIILPCCWKVVAQKWRIGKTKLICREGTFIFQDLDCQPRSDSCLAEAVGRGWTVRPRLDSPDRGKCKFPQGKSIESERFSTSEHYFQAAWIYFLCFLAAQCLKGDLRYNAGQS